MKLIAAVFFVAVFKLPSAQEDVLVIFNQQEVLATDTLHIEVFLAAPQEVEFAVLNNEQLFDVRKSMLVSGRNNYAFELSGIPKGKFILLVTGNNVHEEFDFLVR